MGKYRPFTLLVFAILALALLASGQKKKKEDTSLQLDEEVGKKRVMQTLEVLPDPPAAVTADASRLVFYVTPISANGLLSKQVRDSLKVLLDTAKRNRIVKLRAFVAGSGDTRRVQAVLSEMFAEKRLSLPALTVVQVGALPMQTAQVVLEAVAETRKPVNPHGLAFISGQTAESDQPVLEVATLAAQSLKKVATAAESLGLTAADVLRVTCYCSSLQDGDQVRKAISEAFPAAAANYLQLRRTYQHGSVECEASARLKEPSGAPLRFVNPDGLDRPEDYSQIALVAGGRVTLTGIQMAFRHQDGDIRLAYERLGKVLEDQGTSYGSVAHTAIYPISMTLADKIRTLGFEFLEKSRPPAATMTEFEGLPSLDASFAIDAIAIVPAQASSSKADKPS
jgi:enamine deaminase RidA (YjgF/YER057c/UK114 family)